MKRLFVSILLLSAVFYPAITFAQTSVDPSEISSTIPELTDFHDIIFPMWHEAYPAKDCNALKGFVPKIKSYMESLNKAKLPGILRDKNNEWQKQLNELNNIAKDYYSAADSNDNNALLAAAEKLHSGYEKMVRVVRPALKEIDDFHQSLYVIYHKLLPESKFNEISSMTGTLITKAEAIVNYPHDKLKGRLGDKTNTYDASAKKLYDSILSLQETLKGSDEAKKKEAVESMHSAYEELDSVFK